MLPVYKQTTGTEVEEEKMMKKTFLVLVKVHIFLVSFVDKKLFRKLFNKNGSVRCMNIKNLDRKGEM